MRVGSTFTSDLFLKFEFERLILYNNSSVQNPCGIIGRSSLQTGWGPLHNVVILKLKIRIIE
jgi:hypothetical protein